MVRAQHFSDFHGEGDMATAIVGQNEPDYYLILESGSFTRGDLQGADGRGPFLRMLFGGPPGPRRPLRFSIDVLLSGTGDTDGD